MTREKINKQKQRWKKERRKEGRRKGRNERMNETHVVREADHVHGVDQVFKLLVQHAQVVAELLCALTHVPERTARQDSQRDPIPKRHFPTLN